MFSTARPQRRLNLAACGTLAAAAGALVLSGAIQASAEDLGPFTGSNRAGGVAGASGTVSAIRIAHHDGYDRLVIGFATSNSMPQYQLTRQASSTFVRDASGQPVALEGSAGIRAVLQNSDIVSGLAIDFNNSLPDSRAVANHGPFE